MPLERNFLRIRGFYNSQSTFFSLKKRNAMLYCLNLTINFLFHRKVFCFTDNCFETLKELSYYEIKLKAFCVNILGVFLIGKKTQRNSNILHTPPPPHSHELYTVRTVFINKTMWDAIPVS